jgi:sugar phosphate permease
LTTIVKAPCDEAVIRAGSAEAPCSKRAAPWVLAATILGSSITFIDSTVVNVALPVLQRELGTDIVGAQWIVEAYSLMLSALILVGGSLGDRLGRKHVFSMGLLLFAIASAGCGMAQTTDQLIAARAVQGAQPEESRRLLSHPPKLCDCKTWPSDRDKSLQRLGTLA